MLNRPTDPFYEYIKNYDTVDQNKKIVKLKWAKKYDSIVISNLKYKNIEGYFQVNTKFVTKSFDTFTALSYHLIDKKSLKPNWDPFYNDYSIL